MVKCLPTMWKTQVWSLGQEDPLENEMATHSSTLAWKIPWTEKPGRLQSMGSQKVRHDWATSLLHRNGETDSGRAQTEHCVHQDPGERSSDPTETSPRLARECPGVTGGGVGQWWPAAGWGALSVAVPAWDLLKEVTIIFITSTWGGVWSQVKQQGGNSAQPFKRKLD